MGAGNPARGPRSNHPMLNGMLAFLEESGPMGLVLLAGGAGTFGWAVAQALHARRGVPVAPLAVLAPTIGVLLLSGAAARWEVESAPELLALPHLDQRAAGLARAISHAFNGTVLAGIAVLPTLALLLFGLPLPAEGPRRWRVTLVLLGVALVFAVIPIGAAFVSPRREFPLPAALLFPAGVRLAQLGGRTHTTPRSAAAWTTAVGACVILAAAMTGAACVFAQIEPFGTTVAIQPDSQVDRFALKLTATRWLQAGGLATLVVTSVILLTAVRRTSDRRPLLLLPACLLYLWLVDPTAWYPIVLSR